MDGETGTSADVCVIFLIPDVPNGCVALRDISHAYMRYMRMRQVIRTARLSETVNRNHIKQMLGESLMTVNCGAYQN